MRKRVFELLDVARSGDRASQSLDLLILSLIVLNVIALAAGTVASVAARFSRELAVFEAISVAIFTIEHLLRVWSCVEAASSRSRLRFMASPFALFDLLAILPFYLPLLGLDLRFLRVVRILRVFRIAKLGRYSSALQLFGRVCRRKVPELLTILLVLLVLLTISSSLMYYAEAEAQPEAFSSIPAAMWWGMITLTTVGYGDAVPVTVLGKLLGAAIAILGIGVFALPAGLLGSAFVEEVQGARSCPHCGKPIDS